MQAVEQDFRLFAVIFIHINVEPAVRVRIGQRRQFGGMFFKFAGGGFFGRFAVAGVDRRVFLVEAGSKGRAGGECEQQEGVRRISFSKLKTALFYGLAKGAASNWGIISPRFPFFKRYKR